MENVKIFPMKQWFGETWKPTGSLHAAGLGFKCFQESNRTIEHASLLSRESEDMVCLSAWWDGQLGPLCWPLFSRTFSKEVTINVSTFHSYPSKVTNLTQSPLADFPPVAIMK